MALGVPGTVAALGVHSRFVDWSPGSLGFPELKSACSMLCSALCGHG